jgi:hypothetical protein
MKHCLYHLENCSQVPTNMHMRENVFTRYNTIVHEVKFFFFLKHEVKIIVQIVSTYVASCNWISINEIYVVALKKDTRKNDVPSDWK